MALKCPCCKEGGIEVREKNFFCENYAPGGGPEECNFILWRSDLERCGREKLTEDEAVKLIRGEEIPLKNLKAKSGKRFDCKGKLVEMDSDKGKRWGVQFIFEEKERRLLGD